MDLRGGTAAGHGFMPSSALRWQVAESAVCSWLDAYIASRAAGSIARANTAAAEIKAAGSWPAITGLHYPPGLGPVTAAVDAGDANLVQALIDTGQGPGNCAAIGPFPPAGMSTADQRAKLAAANRAGQQELARDRVAQKLGIKTGANR